MTRQLSDKSESCVTGEGKCCRARSYTDLPSRGRRSSLGSTDGESAGKRESHEPGSGGRSPLGRSVERCADGAPPQPLREAQLLL